MTGDLSVNAFLSDMFKDYRKVSKQFVDMQAYAGCLEKKLDRIKERIEELDSLSDAGDLLREIKEMCNYHA